MTQKTITNFFKTKLHSTPSIGKEMEVATKKKRVLSLVKTPTPAKSPKMNDEDKYVDDLSVWSDDDDFITSVKARPQHSLSQSSVDSDKTVIYSVSPKTTTQTPKKSPQKSPTCASSFKTNSPGSKNKYFSPNKKRSVKNRTPLKSKKNLNIEFSKNDEEIGLFANFHSVDAADGNDDKTMFFIQMIDKYLEDGSLRPLLESKSQELLQSSRYMPRIGMKLICRLFWRKDVWFKRQDLNKVIIKGQSPLDDPSLDQMTQSLVGSDWLIQDSNSMTFDELSLILKAEEIKQICKDLKLKFKSKQGAVDSLRSFSRRTSNINSYFTNKPTDNSTRVLKIMRARAGPCYKLSKFARSTLNKLYVLMYLGADYSLIRERKLELALIQDKAKIETYPVDEDMVLDNATVVFDNNEEFERYMTAHDIYEGFLSETDPAAKSDTVRVVFEAYKAIKTDEMSRYKALPVWLRRFTPAHLHIRILDAGVQDLKKEGTAGALELAVDILTRLTDQSAFRQHKRADWYAEKALILHSLLHRCDEAAEVLLDGFKSNLPEEDKDLMRRRAIKIAQQKTNKISDHLKTELLNYADKDDILERNLSADHVEKQPMENYSKGKTKFETKTTEGRIVQTVEEFCISHYISTGQFTDGEHWEGKIVTTIFFLLFWDIIYSKPRGVRGVFLSRLQVYPLDLFTEGFYVNRQALIEDRLRLIEGSSEDELVRMMKDAWDKRPDYELPGARGVSWAGARAAARAGGRALAALCARLARRYRRARAGFPDLTLWSERDRRIKFVEVKTDSDHLSIKQIQWLRFLREHGLDAGLCYVGAHTTKQRCRPGKIT